MLKHLGIVGLVVGALALAPPAQAVPITGSISFSGSAQPLTGTNWQNTTGIDFGTDASVTSAPLPSGSYAGTQGIPTTFTDFTFSPFAGVSPLWTFTSGNTYSFVLSALPTVIQSGNDSVSFLLLAGSGTLSITGFTPTPGLFNLSAQGLGAGTSQATFSFSSSNIASPAVPEPASMMLLGTGLIGLAGAARRRFRKNG